MSEKIRITGNQEKPTENTQYTGDTLPDTKTQGKNPVGKKPGNVFLDRMQRISAPRIRALRACLRKNRPVILDQKINFPYILGY